MRGKELDQRIKRLISEWLGKNLNGWIISDYVNAGKSALVFKGTRDGVVAAIKVFDPDIIERFGRKDEEDRINRELKLVGAHHPNLVKILDGGYSKENDLFFVAMEFIEAPNLAMLLKEVPETKVGHIISQIASAAEFLEQNGIVHRDIKPDNIAILPDFSRATLLDLGVIRPFERNSEPLTDREKQVFIGTLQYGSPEFLMRAEEQSVNGYRAVTFYQLGAVLHDLLMRRRIFEGSTDPYPKLVQAVLHTKPEIDPTGRSPYLVSLAKNCLVKDWKVRLELVCWKDFSQKEVDVSNAATAKELIRKRRALAVVEAATEASEADWERVHKQEQLVAAYVSRIGEQIRAECAEGELPPRIVTHQEDSAGGELKVRFKKSARDALPTDLIVLFRVRVMDFEGEVLGIDVAAVATDAEPEGIGFATHSTNIFRGVYEDSVARAAITRVLYPVIAMAMDVPTGALPQWISVPESHE